MHSPPEKTPDTQIARWNALKAHLADQAKAFADYCKPFKDEQSEIEAWLMDFLNTTGQNSARTDNGTAYKSRLTQPKITDRTAFLDWVLENWDTRGAMLQIGSPQVAAFEEYIEHRTKEIEAHVANCGGVLPVDASVTPPGTTVDYFTVVRIRKS